MLGRFKELPLVDVFFFYVRVNFDGLALVIFHVVIKALVYGGSKLVMIIDVLDDPVDSVSKRLNHTVVIVDSLSRDFYRIDHLLLLQT